MKNKIFKRVGALAVASIAVFGMWFACHYWNEASAVEMPTGAKIILTVCMLVAFEGLVLATWITVKKLLNEW